MSEAGIPRNSSRNSLRFNSFRSTDNSDEYQALSGDEHDNGNTSFLDTSVLSVVEGAVGRDGGLRQGIWNLASTILGAGALGLALSIKALGLALGTALLVLFAGASLYTLYVLLWCSQKTGCQSYKSLAQEVGFPTQVVAGAIFFNTWGSMVIYVIVIDHILPQTFKHWGGAGFVLANKYVVLALVAGLVLLPLSLIRKLSLLRYTSVAAVACICYVAGVMTAGAVGTVRHPPGLGPEHRELVLLHSPDVSWLAAFPTFIYAYSCHVNVFSVLSELKVKGLLAEQERDPELFLGPRLAKSQRVCTFAVLVASVIYTTIGVSSYVTFLDATESDILMNYPPNDSVMLAGKLCYMVVLCCAYPLNCHPCLDALDKALFPSRRESFTRRTVEACLLNAVTILVALVLPSITTAFAVVGGTATCLLLYILPGLYYLKIFDTRWSEDPNRIACASLMVLAACVTVGSIVSVALTRPVHHDAGHDPAGGAGHPTIAFLWRSHGV